MKTIKPFMDLGIHTVPLRGELKREPDGSKTVPTFESAWRDKYTKTFNQREATLGGAITGAVSNIIAIDCDDQLTFDTFKQLDPTNKFIFESLGKPLGGGTLIYRHSANAPLSFAIHSEYAQLDFYNDNGFVYLPTDANKTKVLWPYETADELPEIPELPVLVERALQNFYAQYAASKLRITNDSQKISRSYRPLAKVLSKFVETGNFTKELGRPLTPIDFRTLPQYLTDGYLHPQYVPDARGSEYLSKISAILGSDISVSQELYEQAMWKINELWENPLPAARLMKTVIEPMLKGTAAIGGEPIWRYDPDHQERTMYFESKIGISYEAFFDDIKHLYWLVDTADLSAKEFSELTGFATFVGTTMVSPYKRAELADAIPVVRTISSPALPTGYVDGALPTFNIFRPTRALQIVANPNIHTEGKRPEVTLKYLENLMPDEQTREYVLSFLKRKLITFEYSPVVLYFLGISGSGKDTFVRILEAIIGDTGFAKPSAKEFIDQYNGWLEDKYFVQLDEYGNQLSKYADKEEALGKIKAYTGKEQIQIRRMRTDGYQTKHNVTFIMTANSNPLMLEEHDRRVVLIETPNKLKDAQWVEGYGGISKVIEAIENEILDFAWYLGTEVNILSKDSYHTPPTNHQKNLLIASTMPPAMQIAYFITNGMTDEFLGLFNDHELSETILDLSHTKDKVYDSQLKHLFSVMAPDAPAITLTKTLRLAGLEKKGSTYKYVKDYYYAWEGISRAAAELTKQITIQPQEGTFE